MDLISKHAIVTGAGSGMGQAITWKLVEAGCQVHIVGRTLAKLETTRAGSARPDQVWPITVDVADRTAVEREIASAITRAGAPFLLVNNAGVNIRHRRIDVLSPADFDKLISTNLTGAFNVLYAVLPSMREARDGVIVTISSIAGLRPLPLAGAAYSASKFGVNGLMGTVGREVAGEGIRCTTLCPGEVATPILDERPVPVTAEQKAAMLQPQDVAEAVLFIAKLPSRAHVQELVLKPLVQDYG
ncbi:SDR family oxidoreductase [bacterium]|nr:SDR family oxidoreductase [bacterium]